MFRLIRTFLLTCLLVITGVGGAYAASVPVTVEDNLGGLIPGNQRNTCSPDVMEVIENRAWEGAQREITQNANLIPRPDSVLSLTCFDSWLDDLADYSESNFPGDPDESDGRLLNGLLTDLIVVLPDDIISGIDPNLTEGYVLYAILEILVLDQLMDVGSITGQVQDALGLALCGGTKLRYIEDNFPDLMIGDRAKTQSATPAYSSINAELDDDVDETGFNGCARMNQVWQRSKCYDFATESPLYKSGHSGPDHDRFYTLAEYEANASGGDDYRTEANQCPPPDSDLIDVPSAGDLLCWTQAHGVPSPPAWAGFITGFSLTGGFSAPGGGPTWTQAHTAANPAPGAAGGADVNNHFLDIVTGLCSSGPCPSPAIVTTCADPIKTGLVVTTKNSIYQDAVCPNPGCTFNAPSSLSANGTCSP